MTVQDTLDLHSLEENWKVVSIVERKIFDFDANSYFHAVYIPKTQWTIKICKELAANYKELLRLPIKNFSRNNSGDISLTSEDNMVFTGMMYIYYNDDLSLDQLGDLYKTYEKMNLSVRFRGWEYLSHYIMEYERHNANEIKTFKKSYPNFTP